MSKLLPLLAALAVAATAPLALAQPAEPAADTPLAPVPRVPYRSVFEDTPRGVEQAREDWKKANAEVGRFPRGHVDLLKWEEAQQGQSPRPAAPAPSPAASTGARP